MWFWPIFGLIFGITMVYESIGRKEYLDLLIGTGYIETDRVFDFFVYFRKRLFIHAFRMLKVTIILAVHA